MGSGITSPSSSGLSFRIFKEGRKNIFHFETKANSRLWNSFDDFNIDKKLSMARMLEHYHIINIKIRQYTFPSWFDWEPFWVVCWCDMWYVPIWNVLVIWFFNVPLLVYYSFSGPKYIWTQDGSTSTRSQSAYIVHYSGWIRCKYGLESSSK